MNQMEKGHFIKTQLIDIDKVILEKNPKLYKRLPKFVIKYIKKTLHQDELNEFIKSSNHLPGIEFLRNSFTYFDIRSKVYGEENLPEKSKVIFASNHPIGSFDGLHLIDLIFSKYGKVKGLVNDLLLNVKNLNAFFLGVNKHGLTAREYIHELNSKFDSDVPIFFFPAGFVSRRKKGKISDIEWKKTFISRAIKHERDIIPIHIEGRLSNKFYRIFVLRNLIGIKTNIEMFYLGDELFKLKGKTLKITIGKPISYKKLNHSATDKQWAQKIREHVYMLGQDINTEF